MFNQNFMKPNSGCCNRQQQVIEPTINKCVQKDFYHEVPQDCPFMIEKLEINEYKSIDKY